MLPRPFSLLLFLILPVVASVPLFAEELAGTPVTVLSRSVVEVPVGTVTYLRIRPPLLPARPTAPTPAPEAALTPELQALRDLAEAKPFASLAVTATVYTRADGSVAVTELTWHFADRAFRAWSNADFRLLRQISDIETETHRFQWFPFVDAQPLAECAPDTIPAGLALFASTPAPDALPEYYLGGSDADTAATGPVLEAFDQLHALYHLRKAELAADLLRREAEAAEQARVQAEEATKPTHEKIYFWKIQ